MWSLVRKAIRDRALADDVVQEVFISLWKAADGFDPEKGTESVFVTTIARRRIVDELRSRERRREAEPIEDQVLSQPDESAAQAVAAVELADEAATAMAALEELRPEQKRMLELWFVGGMTHTEIATSTGVPLGTVKSQIRRGILKVRDLLGGSAGQEVTA